MARRASNPPTKDLHDMTKTWSMPRGGQDAAPGESLPGARYSELLDLFDGKVHTKKTQDYSEAAPAVWPAGLEPSDHWGHTCGECFVQVSRSGDCMC